MLDHVISELKHPLLLEVSIPMIPLSYGSVIQIFKQEKHMDIAMLRLVLKNSSIFLLKSMVYVLVTYCMDRVIRNKSQETVNFSNHFILSWLLLK